MNDNENNDYLEATCRRIMDEEWQDGEWQDFVPGLVELVESGQVEEARLHVASAYEERAQ